MHRRRSRSQKVFGGADENPKETSMFGSIFGSAETTPIDDEKKQEEAKAAEAEEVKKAEAEAEEVKKAEAEAEEVKKAEAEAEETKKAEDAKEAPSIFSSVFGQAKPLPTATSDEQPAVVVVARPDGNRATKRKKKRKTKNGTARCTAYCRMQAKKRFCPKDRMPTPY
jgi:alpha-galactosidase/6-phospho-beta-glucosidase family protein